jgi:hypothetical protein
VPECRITIHCVRQWQARVEECTVADANKRIAEVLERGRWCARPPKWCRDGGLVSVTGDRQVAGFAVIWHERPGVAVLVVADAAVTVVTKASGEHHRHHRRVRRRFDNRQHSPRAAAAARRRQAEAIDDEVWEGWDGPRR